MCTKNLAIFLVIAVASCFSTVVKLCQDPGTANLNFLNVEGCEDGVEGRCVFVKGNTYSVVVNAEANDNSTATALPYTGKVMLLKSPLAIPVTIFQGDACDILAVGNCPTSVGETFEFESLINITNTYPALQSTLTVEVQDENKKRLLCATFNMAIANALI